MRATKLIVLLAGLLLLPVFLTACNLSQSEPVRATATPTPPTGAGEKPIVAINSPRGGEEFRLGREILVNATAIDDVGVTSIRLFANGQPVKNVSSESPTGDRNRNVVLDYTPVAVGDVTLRVIAYRGAIASDPAEVQIRVVSAAATPLPTIGGGGGGGTAPQIPTLDPNDPTCRAQVTTNLNMRSQPFVASDNIVAVIPNGQFAPIIGRVSNNSWWQVRFGFNTGWISAAFTNVFGNCANVPITAQPTALPATATPTLPPTLTPVPTATNTPGVADLIITSFTGPETVTIPAGETRVEAEFNVVITNIGSRRTDNFVTEVRVLPGGARLETTIGNLRPGEAITITFRVPFTQAGNFTVVVEADSTGLVPEISDANNNASRPVVVIQQ